MIIQPSGDHIKVTFEYHKKIVEAIKRIGSGRWQPEQKVWIFPLSKLDDLIKLKEALPSYIHQNSPALTYQKKRTAINPYTKIERTDYTKPEHLTEVNKYVEQLRKRLSQKGYSPKTIASYTAQLNRFLHFSDVLWDSKAINKYILFLLEEKECSHAYVNQTVNAIKQHLICQGVHGEHEIIEILRPRSQKKLPKVLSQEEVKRIIDCTENVKHKEVFFWWIKNTFKRGSNEE